MKLRIENLTTVQKCYHYSIGTIKSYCVNLNIELHNGFNFLLGDVMGNGWLCSYVLSMANKRSIMNGNFYIDDLLVDYYQVKRQCYYVKYNELKFYNRYRSINSMIIDSSILDDFKIDSAIRKKNFFHLEHWSLLCSCLIGISKKKKILCFPWIPSTEIDIQSERFYLLSEYAKVNDLVIVVPTNEINDYVKKHIIYDHSIVSHY